MGTIVSQRVTFKAFGSSGEAALKHDMSSLHLHLKAEPVDSFTSLGAPDASDNPFMSSSKQKRGDHNSFTPSEPSFKGNFIPYKRNNPQIVHDLWDAYFTKGMSWKDMMASARDLEHGRATLLKEWDVKPAGYKPKSHENTIIRTGTDPMAEETGRGVFSDEDLTANTQKIWEKVKQNAEEKGFTVDEDKEAGFFKIAELNTLVWKPGRAAPKPNQKRFGPYVTNPEVVPQSSAHPKILMEHTLPMYKKGRRGLSEPVENWGKNYGECYETLIQTAKSTHHAMEKSGVHLDEPEKFQRLWELCKMRKSPEALGIFKPGQSGRADFLRQLQSEQEDLQNLMARSYDISKKDLQSKLKYLKQQDRNHMFPLGHRSGKQPASEGGALCGNREDTNDTHIRLRTVQTQLRRMSAHREDSSPFEQQLFSEAPRLSQKLEGGIRITDPSRGRGHSFGHHPVTSHQMLTTRRNSYPKVIIP